MTEITVITPWQNCHELGEGYWQAIEAGFMAGDRVLIVDNGSSPSVRHAYSERTGQPLPEFAHVLRSETNLGFHKACNAGLYRAGTDAVLFLNNDIRLLSADWLSQIRKHLKPGRLVGASLNRTHRLVGGKSHTYVDGWCVGGMTGDLIELEGFDEEFAEPAYWGDVDLSIRARQAGMKLVAAPVGLRHLGNYTTRRQDVTAVSDWNHGLLERKLQVAA